MGKDKYRQLLKEHGLKVTPARLAVLEEIFSHEDHTHPDEILAQLKAKGKKVSRATVYRTLNFLIKKGMMRRLYFDNQKTQYDQNYTIAEHDHLICTECGNVIEFLDDDLRSIEREICARFNFKPARRSVQIFGVCNNPLKCASEGPPKHPIKNSD